MKKDNISYTSKTSRDGKIMSGYFKFASKCTHYTLPLVKGEQKHAIFFAIAITAKAILASTLKYNIAHRLFREVQFSDESGVKKTLSECEHLRGFFDFNALLQRQKERVENFLKGVENLINNEEFLRFAFSAWENHRKLLDYLGSMHYLYLKTCSSPRPYSGGYNSLEVVLELKAENCIGSDREKIMVIYNSTDCEDEEITIVLNYNDLETLPSVVSTNKVRAGTLDIPLLAPEKVEEMKRKHDKDRGSKDLEKALEDPKSRYYILCTPKLRELFPERSVANAAKSLFYFCREHKMGPYKMDKNAIDMKCEECDEELCRHCFSKAHGGDCNNDQKEKNVEKRREVILKIFGISNRNYRIEKYERRCHNCSTYEFKFSNDVDDNCFLCSGKLT